jgi:cytochrome c oxidase assembly factor CtaG
VEPLPLAAAGAALVLYAKGFVRLRRRRPDLARPGNAVAFCAGVLVGLVAVSAPVDELADTKLLTAHMAQHLLLGDVAPLLLVLGLRGPLALFVVPSAVLRTAARSPLRRLLGVVLRPAVALALWAGTMYAWHVPALYDAAVAIPPLHVVEHATFLLTGLLVWTVILDPVRSAGRRAAFAAAVLVAGMPLAELLIVAPPLYPHYATLTGQPLGLTAAEDQSRAGLLMMAEQIATLATVAALLLWNHVELAADNAAPSRGRSG